MNLDNQKKLVQFIQMVAPVLEATIKQAAAEQDRAKKASELIPKVVDVLIQNKRLREDEREKAAAALADPIRALEVLKNVAKHRTPDELGHLGTPDNQTKSASEVSPYVGLNNGERKNDKDDQWFKKLGIRR